MLFMIQLCIKYYECYESYGYYRNKKIKVYSLFIGE